MTKKRHEYHLEFRPPFLEDPNVLVFNHVRYHVPSGALLQTFYQDLRAAIEDSNYREITRIVKALVPYKINTKVLAARRQTVKIDSITGDVAE